MDRRRFLKIAGLAGLAVMAPVGLREGDAAPSKYTGPFWIMLNAGGGWDPTMLCDPKGGIEGDRSTVNQAYTAKDIPPPAGALSYAPIDLTIDGVKAIGADDFFKAHHQ